MTTHHRSRRRISFFASTIVGVLGVLAAGAAAFQLLRQDVSLESMLLFVLLTVAAMACARFPLRMGLGESILTLDSIPFVLGAALLDPALSVVMGIACVTVAMVGQPSLPGWTGWFWRIQTTVGTGLALGVASWAASSFGIAESGVVMLVEAFLVALLLEALFDGFVYLELEAEEPGSGAQLLRAWPPMAANVLLPSVAIATLTPYLAVSLWHFMALLPVLLVGMYGALWVANSQQKEKRRGDRLKDTFSRYVPEGIVDDNIETMQEIELGGEQAELSVLFCDIRGFTSWSEDKGATEVITELNVLLSELSASVMETGGTLDKFTGDGLMAFWGAPVAMDDHAERASRAALDMLQRLDAVNARRHDDGQEPFAIGVAVHSGTAVVGNVGHERRLDYTAIGDTVNTTARLEASTKELGAVLLVSRATVDELGEDLRARAMLVGDVVMKGKARVVEAWALQPLRPELEGVDDEFAA